jgi:hypothetical protein
VPTNNLYRVRWWAWRKRLCPPYDSRCQLKFYSNSQSAGNRTGKRFPGLNPAFIARVAPLFLKQGANLQTPVFRYFAIAGSALLVLLFVSDAYLSDAGEERFDRSLYDSTTYVPRYEATIAVAELHMTHDATPADHIREIFAQFGADESRRKKR